MERLFGLRPRSFVPKIRRSHPDTTGRPTRAHASTTSESTSYSKNNNHEKTTFYIHRRHNAGLLQFLRRRDCGFRISGNLVQGRGERSESTGRRLRTAVRPVVLRPGLVLCLQPAGRPELLRPQLYQAGTVSEQLYLYERDAEQPLGESLHGYRPRQSFLEYIQGSPIDETLIAQYMGEVRFLRAYYFFTLSSLWGDVPLRLKSTRDTDMEALQMPSTPAAEVFDFITTEMEDVVGQVRAADQLNGPGRISKSTVQGSSPASI